MPRQKSYRICSCNTDISCNIAIQSNPFDRSVKRSPISLPSSTHPLNFFNMTGRRNATHCNPCENQVGGKIV